ncbi:hypothetical protein RvY_11644-2 [Ramazzottius varieornatus]|uniref:Transporter n=1 Tax=Ramazzottius varieornatus TaxID=947166 RepID=A0A1D1VGU9_RAMVA|nr:hypothetical protein RvY_11644-2 [Ramazzottius varieornatus]
MENRVAPLDVGTQAGSPQSDSLSSPTLSSPTSTATEETSPGGNSYILIQDELTLPRSTSGEDIRPEQIALLLNSASVSNGKPAHIAHVLVPRENPEEESLVKHGKEAGDGRETWTSGMDFLLSIIGYAVDLAAVWRFPYYAYKNGGGAFLIPYFIMLVIGATPLLYLELLIGQYHRQGPISVWTRISPIFQGIGFCAVMVSFYTSFYYNNILAWSFFYFFASMSSELPWSDCANRTWASALCDANINNSAGHYNGNISGGLAPALRSPAQDYFDNYVLGLEETSGFDSLGWPRWQLVLCLALAYLILFLALFKGVKSSGKVVWVTAIAPYIILLILLIRGVFLPGATDGLKFYLNLDLRRLGDTQVWIDAAVQVFYSIGAGFGVHLALSSYNSFHHPTTRDCLITVGANAAANLLSGFVVFAYLGYMSAKQNVGIEQVAKNGIDGL